MKVLSIDAWGNKKDGYDWNQWFHVGDIDKSTFEDLKTDKQFAVWFHGNGYTTSHDMRAITIEDDGCNVVIAENKTGQPLFAVEYGPEY